ncbi:MAG: hypothetical protein QXH81_09195 [Thermofilaceae archaeon]
MTLKPRVWFATMTYPSAPSGILVPNVQLMAIVPPGGTVTGSSHDGVQVQPLGCDPATLISGELTLTSVAPMFLTVTETVHEVGDEQLAYAAVASSIGVLVADRVEVHMNQATRLAATMLAIVTRTVTMGGTPAFLLIG